MPAKLEGIIKRNDMLLLDPKEIDADHDEGNYCRFNDIDNDADRAADEDLANDIMNNPHGQLEPVGITKNKATGRAVLRYGFRRLRVIRDIINPRLIAEGKEPLPIRAILREGNDDDGFMMNLSENLHRKALSPMDIAVCIRHLVDKYGKSDAEIAALFGSEAGKPRQTSWVSQHRSLLSLSYEHQRMVHAGIIPLSAAIQLASTDPKQHAEIVETALELSPDPTPEPEPEPEPVVETAGGTVETVADDTATKLEVDATTPVPQEKPAKAPKAAKPKKVKPQAMAKAIREKTGKRIAHTLKELKTVLEEISTGNPFVRVGDVLDYIEGNLDDATLKTKIEECQPVGPAMAE